MSNPTKFVNFYSATNDKGNNSKYMPLKITVALGLSHVIATVEL
jgi:hypothetical protein